tara:strand:+ start:2254 stop:3099 length:846 start_codon:yes stop_codon:yes gene_type:complete
MTDKTSTQIVNAHNQVTFNMPTVTKDIINKNAVAKVNAGLPEIEEKTRFFDRSNSQSTLSMMSITMLNGQSPMRMMRQVMAEVEKRKMALAEAQVTHAKDLKKIEELQVKVDENPNDNVLQAELRLAFVNINMLESKINGSFKDIAVLIDTYEAIKEKNGTDDWDEEAFEREEKRHHVRRAFELMYRNLMDGGRASTGTIEYMQQYGIHPQVGLAEVQGYINHVTDRMKKGIMLHANDLEDFLDAVANKYYTNADATTERLYGKKDLLNTDYMKLLDKKSS